MLFRAVPFPTPKPQNFFGYPLLSQEQVKVRTSNFAFTFTGSIQTEPIKNFAEKEVWAYPWTTSNFWIPLSQERV